MNDATVGSRCLMPAHININATMETEEYTAIVAHPRGRTFGKSRHSPVHITESPMITEAIRNINANNAVAGTPSITHFPTPYTDAEKSAEMKVKV